MKRLHIYALIFLAALGNWACQRPLRKNPPNIVLIMADDLGYGGIGCYGNAVLKTPNLDRMAEQGLRFTDFHSNGSVCTPTRAALLTGRYQQRAGLEGVIYVRGETRETGLDVSETTIAELLQAKGYATGVCGKWHLGYKKEYFPTRHGFDKFYGYVSGNVDYHSHYDNAGIYDWWHNEDSLYEEGYVTDLITDHAIEFIKRNKEKPFFLYVPHESPHVPFQGRTDPPYRFSDNEFSYYGPVEDRDRAYVDMVASMDEGIGRILDTLKALALEENTLVMFISDNGAESFGHNGSLRGAKISLHEGGHRVPAIAYWKGKVAPGTTSQTTMTFDLMPTFLGLTQTDLPPGLKVDGLDLSSLLLKGETLAERPLFWRYRNQKAVRKGSFKLLEIAGEKKVFDLESDLGETRDIANEHPRLLRELSDLLEAWEREMDEITQKTK